MDKQSEIKQYWDNQAAVYGESSLATTPDKFSKDMEIENISKYLQNDLRVADIGCGNGYSTFQYIKNFNIKIHGIDYSETMISQAKKVLATMPDSVKNRAVFSVGDVRKTDFEPAAFDTVITDRCLINLVTREDQAAAIKEIHRILKPQGLYLMCENTEQGLRNLNKVREHLSLAPIPVRWHNLYLDEQHILSSANGLFELVQEVRFSSFYFLASRVINARIAQEHGLEPQYDSDINRVAAMCSSLDCFGDFSPLKLFVFRRI